LSQQDIDARVQSDQFLHRNKPYFPGTDPCLSGKYLTRRELDPFLCEADAMPQKASFPVQSAATVESVGGSTGVSSVGMKDNLGGTRKPQSRKGSRETPAINVTERKASAPVGEDYEIDLMMEPIDSWSIADVEDKAVPEHSVAQNKTAKQPAKNKTAKQPVAQNKTAKQPVPESPKDHMTRRDSDKTPHRPCASEEKLYASSSAPETAFREQLLSTRVIDRTPLTPAVSEEKMATVSPNIVGPSDRFISRADPYFPGVDPALYKVNLVPMLEDPYLKRADPCVRRASFLSQVERNAFRPRIWWQPHTHVHFVGPTRHLVEHVYDGPDFAFQDSAAAPLQPDAAKTKAEGTTTPATTSPQGLKSDAYLQRTDHCSTQCTTSLEVPVVPQSSPQNPLPHIFTSDTYLHRVEPQAKELSPGNSTKTSQVQQGISSDSWLHRSDMDPPQVGKTVTRPPKPKCKPKK
jgi:hypothetical protein